MYNKVANSELTSQKSYLYDRIEEVLGTVTGIPKYFVAISLPIATMLDRSP